MRPDRLAARLPEPAEPGWPPGFGATPADREAVLGLSHLASVPPAILRALAWQEGTAAACLRSIRPGDLTEGDEERVRVDRRAVHDALRAIQARFLLVGDEEYPAVLHNLADPPGWLFVRGRSLASSAPAVAVVGARRCSAYGREVAGWVGRGLAAAGITVVSGAARGIDGAAHRGALEAQGDTVAVLGSGIDTAYPSVHAPLIEAIARSGAVISEYPPGTPPGRYRFPARNRIVVALSRAVVVVEGAPGSGSTISAEFAGQLGREVLAVPGPVTSPLSVVPHELIRDGAGLIRGPGDILDVLGRERPAATPPVLDSLRAEERRVFDALTGAPVTADALGSACGLPPGRILAVLMALELRGLVRSSGGRYLRAVASAAS